MTTGNQTIAQALARKLAHLRRAEVIAVAGDSSCTIDFGDGDPIVGVPALLTPEVGMLVHVLVQGGANLILGTTNAATGGGGGGDIDEVFFQTEPPAAPLEGDLWIDSDAGQVDGSLTYFPLKVFDGLDWSPVGSPPSSGGGGGGGTVGDWLWADSLVIGAPGDGNMRGNSDNLNAVTTLSVSKVLASGGIVEGYGTAPGDLLYVTNGPRTFGAVYEVTAVVISGTWIRYDVTFIRGVSGNPVDREDVLMSWTPQAAVDPHTHDEYLTPEEVLAGTGITVARPGDGTVEVSTTEANSVGATYLWRTPAAGTGDPGTGYVRLNSGDPALVTALYISETTADLVPRDVSGFLAALLPGDEIMMTDQTLGAFVRGFVTATGTDLGTYWSFAFEVVAFQSLGSPLPDGEPVSLRLYLGSAASLDHGDLGGLGDDDHPQYAKATDPGLEEVFVQNAAPPAPAKPAVWIDKDGVTGVAPIVSAIPVGGVIFHGGSVVPPEWLLCDGRAVSRTTYAVLYSIIGTSFGAGNGSTTFNLPSLTTRMARGRTTPGGVGGADSHSHPGTDWRTGFTDAAPTGTNNTDAAPNGTATGNGAPDGTGNSGSHDHGTSAAGGHAHGIPSAGSHNHGGTASNQDTQSVASGSGRTAPSMYHDHGIPSSGDHNHGGTNSQSDHGHGRTGENGGHSHTVPNSVHSHGVPGSNHDHTVPNSNHDHNIPTSTAETNLPAWLGLLPIIYSGV